MTRTIDFAGSCIARNIGNGWTVLPGRPHDWTDTEVVAVERRDAEQHAYLIDGVQRDDFAAWVGREFTDADGTPDATVSYEPTAQWQA